MKMFQGIEENDARIIIPANRIKFVVRLVVRDEYIIQIHHEGVDFNPYCAYRGNSKADADRCFFGIFNMMAEA